MKPSGRNLNLTSYDEIFQTEETRIEATQEKVIDIPLIELHPFKNFAQAIFDTSERILVKHLARHVEMKQTSRKAVRLAKPAHLKDGRILRKVAEGQIDQIGDTSTLADPTVVDALVKNRL